MSKRGTKNKARGGRGKIKKPNGRVQQTSEPETGRSPGQEEAKVMNRRWEQESGGRAGRSVPSAQRKHIKQDRPFDSHTCTLTNKTPITKVLIPDMNVTQHLPENLSYKNADPGNWKWKPKSRTRWKLADEDWQDFSAKWYGVTESQAATSLVDPKSPSLSLEPLPRIHSLSTLSIVVRKSYVTMFDAVWDQAISFEGERGAIITGQPGTGKTLFNYYLLVRLLQRKQVVLFCPDGKTMFLFYFNEVYTVMLAELGGDGSLPEPISSSNVFIWSLFDINERKEPKRFLIAPPCLPVQITSPDPIQYKTWEKERMPVLIGLPLWTRDELVQGLQYQNRYRSLLDALRKVYGSSSSSPNPSVLEICPGARALLEEHYSEEDTVQPSPEDALEYLLDAAIDRFGYSVRDVFGAIFNYPMTKRHEKAFNIRHVELQEAVSALARNQSADHIISHRILALSPVYQGRFESVDWNVDFKSDWVARSVIRALSEEQDTVIRQQIRFFRSIPGARVLAGRFLEPLIHRCIANVTNSIWPLINMNSNGTDPPQFALVRDSPVPEDVRFIKVKRNIVILQSVTNLSTHLEDNSYYILEDPNFPFDAFTIEFDRAKKSAILWVLQVTTSRIHGGSTRGYRKIRDIIAILKDELQEGPPLKKSKTACGHATPRPFVQVRYLVVVPKDEFQSQDLQWQFPKGWSENWKKNDHRGEVYCLEVPLALLEGDKAKRVT